MNKTNNTEIIVMAEDNASVPRTLSSSGNIAPEKPSPEEVSLEEKWENAGIGNAFIFGKVMSANPGLLLEFLQVSPSRDGDQRDHRFRGRGLYQDVH